MSSVTIPDAGRMRRSDKWIPWYVVAFFLVIIVADGSFAYLAISTETGLVTEQAYEKGLAYNQTLADEEAQESLGWQSDLVLTDEGKTLTFTLHDRDGQALTGAQVDAHLVRPVQSGHDFTVPMADMGEGRYAAAVKAPLSGLWEARAYATWNGQDYQLAREVMLP